MDSRHGSFPNIIKSLTDATNKFGDGVRLTTGRAPGIRVDCTLADLRSTDFGSSPVSDRARGVSAFGGFAVRDV